MLSSAFISYDIDRSAGVGAPERIMFLPCVCACVCGGGVVLLRGSVFGWGLLLLLLLPAVVVGSGVRVGCAPRRDARSEFPVEPGGRIDRSRRGEAIWLSQTSELDNRRQYYTFRCFWTGLGVRGAYSCHT